MRIRVLYFDGCPSYEPAVAAIREVLVEQDMQAEIELIQVSSEEQAVAEQFFGSPTVQINGEDIEEATAHARESGISCRVYSEGGTLCGWPSKDLIEAKLLEKDSRSYLSQEHDCCMPSNRI